MISREQADRIRDQLLAALAEDAHNSQRLLARLQSITQETGIEAHAAMLLILTHLAFDEATARRHWEAITDHRQEMTRLVGRDVGLRVALFDYFVNVNRSLVHPTLIDLELEETIGTDPSIDALTGLSSDRRFRTMLQTELRRARRYGQKTSAVVIDVDEFREINDRFGTLIGDRLMRELAMVVNNNIRDIDIAARPGEDEVALLLPETDRNEALLVAERFRREVESFFAGRESGGEAVRMTISAGVACYPDDATTPESLLERAAQALYHAKAAGRNAVHAFEAERRRYLRFELEPGRFEVEVLGPPEREAGEGRNLSRSGILFTSPEVLEVGEAIEIRVVDAEISDRPLRIRGRVVRLEELPGVTADEGRDVDRYEVGVALDLDWPEGTDDLLDFFERAQRAEAGRRP